ncbi:group I intron-associated PD-(D/E)XK endonuclease [Micromonospora sp. NPDC049004]|uniref:group I intron-associated PD-(D/E)XK endonuclease n=1 Tax=Micromonospora sp. NPDC049004 TaxID=3154348 RepID=UPI0033CBCF58
MGNPRTYTDDQLRNAVQGATCWADVMEAIGKSRTAGRTSVQAVAARLDLDVSHLTHGSNPRQLVAPAHPFSQPAQHGGRSGLSIAARWFMDRGYNVSIPLEPAAYDLIAESDTGLQRVQVTTTGTTESNGRYRAVLRRTVYDASAGDTARGRIRVTGYTKGETDFFFISTAGALDYLIPVEAVSGAQYIVLDSKYAAFAVETRNHMPG